MYAIKNISLFERVRDDFYSLLDKDENCEIIVKNTFLSEREQNHCEYVADDIEICNRIFSSLWNFNSELLCYDLKECLFDYMDYLEERMIDE